jgi:hypothetical protein
MLAVTHHFVVRLAVKMALKDNALVLSKNESFSEYMVLGDDIII